MSALDEKIAAWRKDVAKSMPGNEKTVRELEDHLRVQIAEQMRAGMPMDEAFDAGIRQLGEPWELAGEFRRSRPSWLGGGYLSGFEYVPLERAMAKRQRRTFRWMLVSGLACQNCGMLARYSSHAFLKDCWLPLVFIGAMVWLTALALGLVFSKSRS
jgi:hypothetical protein